MTLINMCEQEVLKKLSDLKQEQILTHWQTLNKQQKMDLADQIQAIDPQTFYLQQSLLHPQPFKSPHLSTLDDYDVAENLQDRAAGQSMLAKGLMGCLIVAGGQGSRLKSNQPKGMFPITPLQHKSLFQLFAEKTKAASKQANCPLNLAIMTSPENHQTTLDFFEKQHRFGLQQEQIAFFSQQTLPFLDLEGRLFLESPDTLASGPDGNGTALYHFFHSGLWENWYARGIRYLNFILIDNPLADPFDAELLGYQMRHGSDLVVKCTSREEPSENVGILAKEEGKLKVIEYSEMPDDLRNATTKDGKLLYPLANLSLFCFQMDFIKEIGSKSSSLLPLHKAYKAVKYLTPEGIIAHTDHPMAWKFERFIFDLLPLASHPKTLLCPREECFAPLKQLSGKNGVVSVQNALSRSDQKRLERITGKPVKNALLEISQEFYYPTKELIAKWKDKKVIEGSGYIEA